jgi:hypothetical protein
VDRVTAARALEYRLDSMTVPTPERVLAATLVMTGLAVVWANRQVPDESLKLGIVVLCLGLAGIAFRVARLHRAIEATALLTLVLVGGEVMVRRENGIASRAYAERTMHFVDDPLLRYELKPNLVCDKAVTNEFGMIDVPRTLEKPADTLRVACLGDSVGGDCSLPSDNTCAALEPILREARGGKPVEVLNFSVPGYNTMQEARALEVKALRFAPDAVVVLYVLNDPAPDLAISHVLPGRFKFEHLLWSGARLAAWKLAGGGAVDPFEGMLGPLHENPRSWDAVVVAGFDRIRVAAESRHAPVALAVFPLFLEPIPKDYPAIYLKVTREAERHGFTAIDLSTAAFAGEPLPSLLKPSHDLIHPNARAHHLAAAAIARALLARHPELAQ